MQSKMYIHIYKCAPRSRGDHGSVLTSQHHSSGGAESLYHMDSEKLRYTQFIKLSPVLRKNRDASSLVQKLARGDRKSLNK